MKPIDFVAALRSEVIASNQRQYQQWFLNSDPASARDPYWRRALEMFATLPQDQRDAFFEVLRHTAVETMSNVLGIIDGSSFLATDAPELKLSTEDGAKLSGSLQDYFLVAEEDDPAT